MSTLILKPQVSSKNPAVGQPGKWQVVWRTDARVWFRITTMSWEQAVDVALHYDPDARQWSDPCCPNARWR